MRRRLYGCIALTYLWTQQEPKRSQKETKHSVMKHLILINFQLFFKNTIKLNLEKEKNQRN